MQTPEYDPLFSHHRKLVAHIGLSIAVLALLALFFTLFFISDARGESYLTAIQARALTQQRLGPALLVAGLALAACAGLLTWLFTLYNSFRIAGPLYRFTQNFLLAAQGTAPAGLIDIRKEDALQEHARLIKSTLSTLHGHYDAVREAADAASRAMEAGDSAAYTEAITRLKALDEKVAL